MIRILSSDRLLVIKLQVHQPRPRARQTNLCRGGSRQQIVSESCRLCEDGVQSCLSHYNKSLNMGTGKQACGRINNGIPASFFVAAIYNFYENISFASTSRWPHKHFEFILWNGDGLWETIQVWRTEEEGGLTVTRGDDSSVGNWRRFTRTNRRLHSHERAADATQVDAGLLWSTSKILWFCFAKSSQSFWQAARKHCLPSTKTRPTPVEKHAPTNELISDMNCGVYVWAFSLQFAQLPFTALGWL